MLCIKLIIKYCVSCWFTYTLQNDTRSIQYQIKKTNVNLEAPKWRYPPLRLHGDRPIKTACYSGITRWILMAAIVKTGQTFSLKTPVSPSLSLPPLLHTFFSFINRRHYIRIHYPDRYVKHFLSLSVYPVRT